MRQCIGCGEKKGKKELIRIVCPQDGSVSFDFTGRKNGRGAYICNNVSCLEQARKKKAIERALNTVVDQPVYEALLKELTQSEK